MWIERGSSVQNSVVRVAKVVRLFFVTANVKIVSRLVMIAIVMMVLKLVAKLVAKIVALVIVIVDPCYHIMLLMLLLLLN